MRRISSLFAFCGMAALAVAQNPVNCNDLPFSRATGILYFNNDPSVGAAAFGGSNPANDDFAAKCIPARLLVRPDTTSVGGTAATMEIVGFEEEIYDTDWTTPADFGDLYISAGVLNVTTGDIEPDFTAYPTNGILINGANSGFPNPCSFGGCPTPTCPGTGQVAGWGSIFTFGTAQGQGIIHTADGTFDLSITKFVMGGQTLSGGGTCGLGDFDAFFPTSTTETEFIGDNGGNTRYDGFQIGATGATPASGFIAGPLSEATIEQPQYFEPTLNMQIAYDGITAEIGRGAYSFSVANGSATAFSPAVFSRQGYGDLCGAYGSLNLFPSATPLTIPGFTIGLLADPFDPSGIPNTTAGVWAGAVVQQNNGGDPFDNGIAALPLLGPLPAGLPQLVIWNQAILVNLSTLAVVDTQAVGIELNP